MSNEISEEQLKLYYEGALALVQKCGPLMVEGYEKTDNEYEVKGEFFDLVTVYDRKLEDFLTEGLQASFPETLIIGEESSAETATKAILTDAPTWIIDPIDGTTNFIHRIPHCCISVGLAINKILVVGIVYNPITNELYSAWKDHGAYLNAKRIYASKVTSIKQSVIAYEVSALHGAGNRDKNVKRIYKLASSATATRCFGSIALTLCYLATGQVDAYHVAYCQPWDVAAGAVILQEAGGIIWQTEGGAFDTMNPNFVCAGTEELAKDVTGLIEEANKITDFKFV